MKTIKIKDIVSNKGNYSVDIEPYNKYGSGPRANVDVEVTGIPFTIDTEDVTIIDVDDSEINEILSCGQTFYAKTNILDKQLPNNISISAAAEYQYVLNESSPNQATITICPTGDPIHLIFGDLPYDMQPKIYIIDKYKQPQEKFYLHDATTWSDIMSLYPDRFTYELCSEYIYDGVRFDSCIYWLAPDRTKYMLYKHNGSETVGLIVPEDIIDTAYNIYSNYNDKHYVTILDGSKSLFYQYTNYYPCT
jgi:hypothetical protein